MRCTNLLLASSLGLSCAFISLGVSDSRAHDYWDGKNCGPGKQNPAECKVPDWVKSSCCGPSDAHHLTADQVHGPYEKGSGPVPKWPGGYYIIEGYGNPVDMEKALPSQDGEYWIFYKDMRSGMDGSTFQSNVYCFFVPFAG